MFANISVVSLKTEIGSCAWLAYKEEKNLLKTPMLSVTIVDSVLRQCMKILISTNGISNTEA